MEKKKLEIQEVYPLSSLQEGMVFHAELDKSSTAYFEQIMYVIKGKIDVTVFKESVQKLVDRHEILRTVFIYKNVERNSQVVLKHQEAVVNYYDLSNFNQSEIDVKINDLKEDDRKKGFHLSADILLRVALIKTKEQVYSVIWSFHHIIMDGWCLGIINKDLLQFYKARMNGEEMCLKPAPKYKTYIEWVQNQKKKDAEEYWKNFLSGFGQKTIIPFAETKEAVIYQSGEQIYTLDYVQYSKLKQTADTCKVTLNTIFESIWGIILSRYNNTNDSVFGAVTSGRPAEIPRIEEMVGLFINTIPVRIRYEEDTTFAELVENVQQNNLQGEQYSYYPLYKIQQVSMVKRNLIDHILVYENYPMEELLTGQNSAGDMDIRIENVNSYEQTNYDLNIIVVPGMQCKIIFKYNINVLTKAQIEIMCSHICTVINQIIEEPHRKVSKINILSKEEETKLLNEFCGIDFRAEEEERLHVLFEQQAAKTPNAIALSWNGHTMSYFELNQYANWIAYRLTCDGIGRNNVVGLILNRSFEMIAAILGVLKSGACYLPLDPSFPKNRIDTLIQDSKASCILTHKQIVKDLWNEETNGEAAEYDIYKVMINEGIQNIEYLPAPDFRNMRENMQTEGNADDFAYIIYTSGSTGIPKGTLITHKNVNRIVKNTNYVEIDKQDNLLQLSNYAFDGSIFDIFAALVNGAKLTLVDKNTILDSKKLLALMKEEKITVLFITTALFHTLADVDAGCFNGMRYVLFGGEKASVPHVYKVFMQMGANRLIHVYGPTESTVFATFYPIEQLSIDAKLVPIGKPLTDTKAYVLDKGGNLQPIGVAGELCISGKGISLGYLNRDDITKEKFKPNPFDKYGTLYYTGDMVRWNIHGEIEFIGRKDNQIKLRGFRIELEEIERYIMSYEGIEEAVVMSEEINQNMILCAYFKSVQSVKINELREYLLKTLPDYMIPSYYNQVEQMPLTENGKIDRGLLKGLEKKMEQQEFIAPRTQMEEILVRIWEKILKINNISIKDNYFHMGGDSIKAIQIASQLHKENLKLEVHDLFSNPTIESLSPYIKRAKKQEQSVVTGDVELIPIQHWFFNDNCVDLHHFNQSVILRGVMRFDERITEQVFCKLIEQHDALRMGYQRKEGKVIQHNYALSKEFIDFGVLNLNDKDMEEEVERISNQLQEGFDLEKGPLMKSRILRTQKEDYLLIIMHHLIVDGISWRILLDDFTSLYKELQGGNKIILQNKTMSYKEWANELLLYSKSEKISREKDFWMNVVTFPIKKIPVDYVTDSNQLRQSDEVHISLTEKETCQLLRDVNIAYNTEINDILISALGLAVKEWTGAEKISVSLEGHGREPFHEGLDVSSTIGWFTTKYPILMDLVQTDNIAYYIKNIKDMLNRIPDKGLGYGVLRYLSKGREDLELYDKSEISFNYLGQLDQSLKTELFEASQFQAGKNVSDQYERKCKFDINGYVKDNTLTMVVSYNKNQYKLQTVEQFMNKFKSSILLIIRHCMSKNGTELTPTDFHYRDMTIEQLDSLINDLEID